MRSGKLASLSGVSADALRHYERLGLLPIPHRSAANYRDYPSASVQRVQLIQRALNIGFSLDELKSVLGVRDRGGMPCRHVRNMLEARRRDIELQLEKLTAMRAELGRIAKDWDRRLSRAPQGQAARLLENLPEMLATLRPRLSRTRKSKGE
jgi:MerR family Zn(II)-responsive transcriptional regulator of zntA